MGKEKIMFKIILTVGAPSSGKSTWAKAEVAKNPLIWVRVNNDQIREMLNGSVYSQEYEKIVTETRNFLIKEALRKDMHVIVDNVNVNRRHFDHVVKIARASNKDVQVFEKPFYEELEVLIERDSKRTGSAKVGEAVIRKFWKDFGGTAHKFYKPRNEIILKNNSQNTGLPLIQDQSLNPALMVDLDGTISLFNKLNDNGKVEILYPGAHVRNPYDASKSNLDSLNQACAAVINNFYEKGTSILFCSGRKDTYEPQTREFLDRNFPNMKYSLFMRKSEDNRSDAIVKEEIFRSNIENKYNVLFVMDDRSSVCARWREIGLTCFQVAPGDF